MILIRYQQPSSEPILILHIYTPEQNVDRVVPQNTNKNSDEKRYFLSNRSDRSVISNPPVYHKKTQQCPSITYKSREHCSASFKTELGTLSKRDTECRQANSFDPRCGGGLCCFDGCIYKCYDGGLTTTSFYQSSTADSLNDNTVSVLLLSILFSSNHNIQKISRGLCFWSSDPLIDTDY